MHQLLLEERNENACSDPARLVKLKNKQLNESSVEAKTDKSYMEKFLQSPSPDRKVVCETSIFPHPTRLVSDDTCEAGIEIREISAIRPVKRSLGNERIGSWTNDEEPELKRSLKMHRETDGDLVKVHEQLSAGVTDEIPLHHSRALDETELVVDEQNKTERILYDYHSDDATSEVDNYLDALATMESELEMQYEYRPKNSFLHIQKLTDSNDKEHQLQAQFSHSQSFGDSSTSDEISSFKQDINEEDGELQAQLSDSQSGSSFTSDENRSLKRNRYEEHTELHAQLLDFRYVSDSTADVNSSFKKDITCVSYSDSLGTVFQNIQSEPTLLQSTVDNESVIEDISSNQLPRIETQDTDRGEFLKLEGADDQEEEIFGTGQVSSGSYMINSGHKFLYSDLQATSSMKITTGTQSVKKLSGLFELQSRLANEDTKYHVESMDSMPVARSLMKVAASPAVSSEKYPLNNLDDGGKSVSYDATKVSNDLQLAYEDESSNYAEIKVLQAESSRENRSEVLVCREIDTGEHPVCSSMEAEHWNSDTTFLPVSKPVDEIVATKLNEDLSPMVETLLDHSFTAEQCSDLIRGNSQDEPESFECYHQSNFEEISRMTHSDENSGFIRTANAYEDDSLLKDLSSSDYRGQNTAENDVSIASCSPSVIISSASRRLSNLQEPPLSSSSSAEMKKEPNEVRSTKNSVDLNSKKMEIQLEPSSYSNIIPSPERNLTNLEESCSPFVDPHEKQMKINDMVTGLETQKVVHQPEPAVADVQLSLDRSVPFDHSEICNSIQDSSPKERTQHNSTKVMEMVTRFSKLDGQEPGSMSLLQNKLFQSAKDGLSMSFYKQPFLQSQVSQKDAEFLIRNIEDSSPEKLQTEQMQMSNHLEEERSTHTTSEIHPDQLSSSEFLSQSAGQEANHTTHAMNEPLPFLPDRFPQASEIKFGVMPPMPPLPPMQWRTSKFQHASLASHREVFEVSQASVQPMQPIKSNEKGQYDLPTSERETLQYLDHFLPVRAVEGDNLQLTSGFSIGGHTVGIPLELPLMQTNGQHNYLVLESSQIQNPILTLPVPVVSTSKPPHDYVVASERETEQNSNPSPPMPPVEHAISGQEPISPLEESQPPSQLVTEPSLEVETLQQSSSNMKGEKEDPSVSTISPPIMENVQPNHNLLPSEGEKASTIMDTSALTSDFEWEKLNGKPKNKLPRPPSPLIDAVAALDKSKVMTVTHVVITY